MLIQNFAGFYLQNRGSKGSMHWGASQLKMILPHDGQGEAA
jgi:hypothetical protein